MLYTSQWDGPMSAVEKKWASRCTVTVDHFLHFIFHLLALTSAVLAQLISWALQERHWDVAICIKKLPAAFRLRETYRWCQRPVSDVHCHWTSHEVLTKHFPHPARPDASEWADGRWGWGCFGWDHWMVVGWVREVCEKGSGGWLANLLFLSPSPARWTWRGALKYKMEEKRLEIRE